MKSLEELVAIRDRALQEKQQIQDSEQTVITIGMATCGITAGARPVFTALLEAVGNSGIQTCSIKQTGCFGRCQLEPMMTIQSKGQALMTYVEVTPEKAVEIFESHVLKDHPLEQYLLKV